MTTDTVDGRIPANQLRLVVYPIIYRVLYISGGWKSLGFLNHHQQIPQATANEMLPRIEGNSLDLSEEPAKGGGHRGESDGKGPGDQLRVQKHLRKL